MNKKENRMAVRQTVEKAVLRDEQNQRIQFAAANPVQEVLKSLHTTLRGLDAEAVAVSRTKYGSNKVTHEKKQSLAKCLAGAFINPFTAILFCLAVVSTITDMVFPYFALLGSAPEDFDPLTVVIILTMVIISGTLRFVQESRSGNAAEKLLAMITTTCTVTRREQEKIEIPMDDLVVGDIVHLAAGDMIPADVRILEAKDLFISQSSLTGESEPIEKTPSRSVQKESITDYTNIAFMGSNVISGSAAAVVVSTGDATLFGSMASAIAGEAVETSFTKGVNAVSWVLIRFMLVMVPLVFFINGITKGDWLNAFLFGISIAVGLTPEMLPMIVTTCLQMVRVTLSLSPVKIFVVTPCACNARMASAVDSFGGSKKARYPISTISHSSFTPKDSTGEGLLFCAIASTRKPFSFSSSTVFKIRRRTSFVRGCTRRTCCRTHFRYGR